MMCRDCAIPTTRAGDAFYGAVMASGTLGLYGCGMWALIEEATGQAVALFLLTAAVAVLCLISYELRTRHQVPSVRQVAQAIFLAIPPAAMAGCAIWVAVVEQDGIYAGLLALIALIITTGSAIAYVQAREQREGQ